MKYFNPDSTQARGESMEEDKEQFQDIDYFKPNDAFDSMLLNTTIREIALQNAFDAFEREDTTSKKFVVKISKGQMDIKQSDYFAELKKNVQYAINASGDTAADERNKGAFQRFMNASKKDNGVLTYLKIEDNGGGLTGTGYRDSFTTGMGSILAHGLGSGHHRSGGSFGKGGKTAQFLSATRTIYYHNHRDKQDFCIGVTSLPAWEVKDLDGMFDSKGMAIYNTSEDQDENALKPKWATDKSDFPQDVKRTIEGDGLTVTSIGVTLSNEWEYECIFAILTSHLPKLLDCKCEWEFHIGSLTMNAGNILELCERIPNQSFYTQRGAAVMKLHYQMCMDLLHFRLGNPSALDPKDKFERGYTSKGGARREIVIDLLFGSSNEIKAASSDENGGILRTNHFLFVRNGMIIRTDKYTNGLKSENILRLENTDIKCYGFLILDSITTDTHRVFKKLENPSHDTLKLDRLDRDGDEEYLPQTKRAMSQMMGYIETHIINYCIELRPKSIGEASISFLKSLAGEDPSSDNELELTFVLQRKERINYPTPPPPPPGPPPVPTPPGPNTEVKDIVITRKSVATNSDTRTIRVELENIKSISEIKLTQWISEELIGKPPHQLKPTYNLTKVGHNGSPVKFTREEQHWLIHSSTQKGTIHEFELEVDYGDSTINPTLYATPIIQ